MASKKIKLLASVLGTVIVFLSLTIFYRDKNFNVSASFCAPNSCESYGAYSCGCQWTDPSCNYCQDVGGNVCCSTGGGGGSGACTNCGSGAGIIILSLQDSGSSFVVNWSLDSGGFNQACLNGNHYHYEVYIGTDYNAVNGNCNNINSGNYDYRGGGGAIPPGCQSVRQLGSISPGTYSGSFNSAAAVPPITLYPLSTYYVKVVVWVSNPNNGFWAGCFSDMTPFSSACTISSSDPQPIAIGGPPAKFTVNASNSGNTYTAPTPITTSISWTPGYCPGKDGR